MADTSRYETGYETDVHLGLIEIEIVFVTTSPNIGKGEVIV
jgi:hypothetical protein